MSLAVDASSKPGQALIPILLQKGYPVRAFFRDGCQLPSAQSLGVQVIEGDVRQPDTLLRVCEGAEAVVSSVTLAENRPLIDAAKRSGIRHFILISAYRPPSSQAALWRLELQTEEYLKTSGLDYTILQSTPSMDIWCAPLGMQLRNGQAVTILGDGRNPINFVSAQDVATFAVFALEDPRLCNRSLTIAGPQNLTFEHVVSVYEKILSKCAVRNYVSTRQMQWLRFLYSCFDKTRARSMAIQHQLATFNWQVDMTETIKHYPINLTTLEDWILERAH